MKKVIYNVGMCVLLATIFGLAACTPVVGGTQLQSVVVDMSSKRALPTGFSSLKAVAYSGYRTSTNSDADIPTLANVIQDLNLLKAQGFGLLRVFSTRDADNVLKAIADTSNGFSFKVQLGIWISGPNADKSNGGTILGGNFAALNATEIATGIAMANSYKDIVVTVSIGNETMIDWTTLGTVRDSSGNVLIQGNGVSVKDMAGYIKQVHDAITQPVTTDDNWAFFTGKHSDGTGFFDTMSILQVVDYVSIHSYACLDAYYAPTSWDWTQYSTPKDSRPAAMMDAAIVWTKSNYTSARNYLNAQGCSQMPIIIGETGWKSVEDALAQYRGHQINQKMYFDGLQAWRNESGAPASIVYFEAFDEPWKGGDDNWGLWDVSRTPKYVVGGATPSTPAVCAPDYVPTVPVTKSKYILFSEAALDTNTEAKPSATAWNGWESWQTVMNSKLNTTDGSEGSQCQEIGPTPLAWGWGMALGITPNDDLSYYSDGYLNFSIKTDYPGKIEVGFRTLNGTTSCDVYLPISSGQYGYSNATPLAWHNVKIPIATIKATAAAANLMQVADAFVIADRYSFTGNTAGATNHLLVDNIYWSKN